MRVTAIPRPPKRCSRLGIQRLAILGHRAGHAQTARRYAARWPGVLEGELGAAGLAVRVIEDCLNGRRTVWDDPFKPGRNGFASLQQRIEIHSPLALVVLMLGTNDFQVMHATDPWQSSQGIAALVRAIRSAPIEPGMPVPEVLIVAPPVIQTPKGRSRRSSEARR